MLLPCCACFVVPLMQVLLEPWADLLRHPPAAAGAAAGAEVVWSYGLCRNGTSVVSRGVARRIAAADQQQQQQGKAAAADQHQQADVLLAAGEELWASSDGGELFVRCIEEQGHLAPLTWYLQHGSLPEPLAAVPMR